MIILTTSVAIPAEIISPVIISGSFGKLLTTNRKCGWNATNITQNKAKYNIKGVKIASAILIAKKKE